MARPGRHAMTPEAFVACATANPINAALLARLPALALPQCHLVAGCLFQAVWNARSGATPDHGIADYDIFYFDDDLSWEAEDAVIKRVAALTADLGCVIQPRNQARVHLWYGERFGADYPRLRSAREGIDLYLVECTCVGIDVHDGALYAPNGLDDLESGILRINPRNPRPELFMAKAATYRTRWPWLTMIAP